MKSLKDMDPRDFHCIGKPNTIDLKHRKALAPYCRLKPEYRDLFHPEDYEVKPLPKEIYELFQKEASR